MYRHGMLYECECGIELKRWQKAHQHAVETGHRVTYTNMDALNWQDATFGKKILIVASRALSCILDACFVR